MKINLLCSQRLLPNHIFEKEKDSNWAGIDRGALILVKQGIQPIFSVGDFDSVNNEERLMLMKNLQIEPVEAKKDDTDLALGVAQAVERGYTEITIYGATGGRLDHFMGVLQILQKPQYLHQSIKIKVIDQQNHIQLLNEGKYVINRDSTYPYISFIPLNDKTILTLQGFKYNLNQEHLNLGSTLTISNEVKVNEAIIRVEQGTVLKIRSRD